MNNFISRRFTLLVSPQSEDQEQRSKEFILNILLVTGLLLIFSLGLVIFVSILVLQYHYLVINLLGVAIALLFLSGLFSLSRRGYFKYSAILLIFCFLVISSFLIFQFGVYLPQGILLFSLTIVMTGVLLGSRTAFMTAVLSSIVIYIIHLSHSNGVVQPSITWHNTPPGLGDVLGYALTFFAITSVSWLMHREVQRSLQRAKNSERALREYGQLLETKVTERTRELHTAQMEKLSHLHKFAELGYTTTALFHDLANRITALSMEVESLGADKHDRAKIVKQVNGSIAYIKDMIGQVRQQVMEHEAPTDFGLVTETADVINSLSYKKKRQKVDVVLRNNIPTSTQYYGDRVVFRQIIGCLVDNAIDAYDDSGAKRDGKKLVTVAVKRSGPGYAISVADRGNGIDPKNIDSIFEPFYTTKKEGMGIGLFIARRMAEQQYGGKLTAENQPGKGATFTLTLPRKKKSAKKS